MAIFKCKMCGGSLELSGKTVGICGYCGTKQSLPIFSNEQIAGMYERANHFRRNNEYDKAAKIYEQIINEKGDDAEAYWSLVLCNYGIEYVEEPGTRKRVPTVNRTQFTSIFDDINYKSAIKYGDFYQKEIYEQEAKVINDIQKGILAVSNNEAPFDVFICYKETDNGGKRTRDSVLAAELYKELTREGFKVFFARITLEDKLGTAYEPYIFAALNSSKVMVVLGTKPEHFNAVWVKNEWSRYLALIKKGERKVLIPAYRDMDPYDLPEEMAYLQSQDMSKLGFMQELISAITKISGKTNHSPSPMVNEEFVAAKNPEALLKRAYLFIEDEEWRKANSYCEEILDIDPENVSAYLAKLLIEKRVKSKNALAYSKTTFDESSNFKKIMRFGDPALKNELIGYNKKILENKESAHLEALYSRAERIMNNAKTERDYHEAAELFSKIYKFKDAGKQAVKCRNLAEYTRKNNLYKHACSLAESSDPEDIKKALKIFESMNLWMDSAQKSDECKIKLEEIKLNTSQLFNF